ncbi:CAP domain-containing protein [Candidatus Uhrbacteria bacterium]|nr:CAP domain-containing protein [Candidatus Uhrbacteria bacterium]
MLQSFYLKKTAVTASRWSFLRDCFIPHEGNNHHPHALRHHVLAGYSVGLILLKVLAVVLPIALPFSSLFSSAVTPQNIISLTNQARKEHGLSTLRLNSLLSNAASARARDMLEYQYFAHTSPQGLKAWDFIRRAGYQYLYSGENLAVHYSTAEDVEGGWMLSATHRANVLNPKYEDIGVGVAYGAFEGTSTIFVVQMFGTPVIAEERPAAAILPASVVKPKIPTKQVVAVQQVQVATTTPGESIKTEEPVVVPKLRADQLDVFTEGGTARNGFQEYVRLIYLFAVVFLFGGLIVGFAYRLHLRNAPVIAHTMGVIVLAICLALV